MKALVLPQLFAVRFHCSCFLAAVVDRYGLPQAEVWTQALAQPVQVVVWARALAQLVQVVVWALTLARLARAVA